MSVIFRDPTADWTPAQRQTHEAFEPLLEDAGRQLDEAMETHAAAQQAHAAALLRAQVLGVSQVAEGMMIVRPLGAPPTEEMRPRNDAEARAGREEAREAAQEALDTVRDAEAHLGRARAAYYTLAARRDTAVARAVMTGEAGKPRSSTAALLERIRDRVMG